MTASYKEKAHAVGTYVDRKIQRLQKAYLGSDNRAKAKAMANLAHLRRLSMAAPQSWMDVGELVFVDWPEEELGLPDDNSYELNAVEACLSLYAYHQQSQKQAVAAVIAGATDEERRQVKRYTSFAQVCRRIYPRSENNGDLEQAQGVMQRLKFVESSRDFNGFVVHMRNLIALIKSAEPGENELLQIDYRSLGEDLYIVQFPGAKKCVMERWGREYFSRPWGPNAGNQR